MLKVENLTIVYPDGTKVTDEISFHIASGKKVALIGENGAGKTSLLLAIAGVLSGSGNIYVDGEVLTEKTASKIKRKVGVLFQNPDDQLFMPTVYDDIAFGPRNFGVDEETIRYRVEDRLNLLSIAHLKDKTALKLSGGEKRMVALATVLVMKPSLMLFDEPTAFLDTKARRQLINVLKKLPHTMFIATHDFMFAREVCDEVLVIKNGKISDYGEPDALLFDEKRMEQGGLEALSFFYGKK